MPIRFGRPPKIVVIGGGNGGSVMLSALKNHTQNLSGLVAMADDGGSTGVLRNELGTLPAGDVRQFLVALSRKPELRDAFSYRFSEGVMSGHVMGNIFLSALQKSHGNFADAVHAAGQMLDIAGQVIPITLDNARLILVDSQGGSIVGEHLIDVLEMNDAQRHPKLLLEPQALINPVAKQAIEAADLVVLAPGDLYTSLGAALVVQGVGQALASTTAKVAYVCNLVVKPGHTDGFSVSDHAAEIERFGGANVIDYVLYNDAPLPEGVQAVPIDQDELQSAHYKAIAGNFVATSANQHHPADQFGVPRSSVRHDAEAVAKQLLELL